jgi:hypothetical protein
MYIVYAMARHRMYDVNSATAIHLELLADIPRKLADKIVAYRKKRKRIFYIDELYRVRGISSKYFERLLSVFYATSQVIPGIGVNIQYNYKLSTVTGKQKRQSRDDNLKKRKMKIKKRENQRKIENRDRKRKLQKEEISTQSQYKPLGKKYYLNSTNLKKLDTVTLNKLPENLGKKEGIILKSRKEKDRSVKRQKTTDTENGSDSSESTPMIQRANINERVARLLKIAAKFEGDNVEMEKGNTGIRKNRKRKYQCVKRTEIKDTEQRSDPDEREYNDVYEKGSQKSKVKMW